MKKSVLLLIGELYPDMNANSLIAYHVGQELKRKYDYDISIFGWYVNPEKQSTDNPYKLRTISMDSMNKYHSVMGIRNHKLKKLIKFLFTPRVALIFHRIKKYDLTYAIKCEYIYAMKQELRRKKYDCVIGFTTPYLIHEALQKVRGGIPLISYMLDPWSTCYLCKNEYENTKTKELRVAESVEAIISSSLVYDDYVNRLNANKQILTKFHVLEYPNILPFTGEYSGISFDKEKINCVFTGKLYDTIRKPKYAIELFSRLEKYNIVFHIVGRLGKTDPKTLPSNVIYHGEVSTEEANSYMLNADLLVNIGNSELNLMPSKIFTYMSTGKPILNIMKSGECPTLRYMNKYPLAYNVLETEEVLSQDVESIRDFIISNYEKSISFDSVKKLYYECTPEFVGKKVDEIIRNITERSYERKSTV